MPDDKIPESIKGYLDPRTPLPTRLLAARGLLPLPSQELIYILYHLLNDPEARVRNTSFKTIIEFPQNLICFFLEKEESPEIINFFAQNFFYDEKIIEAVLLNPYTSDETFALVARWSRDEYIIDLIANNQERILRYPPIVESLKSNPRTPTAAIEKIAFWEKMLKAEPEAEEPPAEIEEAEIEEKEPPPSQQQGEREHEHLPEPEKEERPEIVFPRIFVADKIAEWERDELPKKVSRLGLQEKIELARWANRPTRNILMRDGNREVGLSILQNERVEDQDIIYYCHLRDIHPDILRTIGLSLQWSKNYQIRYVLVKNPKTPLFLVLRFLTHLDDADLEKLARSKDVSGAIANSAQQLIERRKIRKDAQVYEYRGPQARETREKAKKKRVKIY